MARDEPYLDKPHLLFWLAALCFKLFGVTDLAYRLPSLLFSALGVYATARLGRLLYSAEVGRLAALILASAFAFILANSDVRMDAMLTACIIFATWQLAEWVKSQHWRHLTLAALGLALGLATKGMVGVVMPGIAIFMYLLYRRDWARLFDWRWLLLAALMLVFALPLLYAYYQQFGFKGVSFILWSQSFERMAGERFSNNSASDHLFFIHTLFWAFLPWSLLSFWAAGARIKALVQQGLKPRPGVEFLTLGTLLLMFVLISSSRFKLPHYLNILFPLLAILVAAWLQPRLAAGHLRGVWWLQGLAIGLLLILGLTINLAWFPPEGWAVPIIALGLLGLGLWWWRSSDKTQGPIIASLVTAAVFNFLLNANFYPQLLQYQAGTSLGQIAKTQIGPEERLAYLEGDAKAWSFDFNTAQIIPTLGLAEIADTKTPHVLYLSERGLERLTEAGLKPEVLAQAVDYRVSRLGLKFLRPETRPLQLKTLYLVRVR
jgi:4-amino-4-deoxy-L-arabinose transferase-like glycosyltransferase